MPRSNNRFLTYFLLLISASIWGVSTPIIKYSFQFIEPLPFLFFRYLFASLLFIPIFLVYKAKKKQRINHFQTLLVALIGTPFCLIPLYAGINLTSSLEASLLDATSPLFTVILCVFFLKEKLSKKELKGLLIAVSGTLMIVLEPLLRGSHQASISSVEGNLLILLGALIWSFFLFFSKKLKINPTYLSFYSFVISIPFFYVASVSTGSSLTLSPLALPGVLFMSIAGSIIAFWTYQEGQKRIEASEAVVFSYLKPIFAIPLSIMWLKDAFSPIAIIATIFIALGVYISETR